MRSLSLKWLLPTFLLACLPAIALAADTAAVMKRLKATYPATQFDRVTKTPVAGVFEVKMGENIVYVTPDGRYWFVGVLFDMPNQIDLTAKAQGKKTLAQQTSIEDDAPVPKARKFDFGSLPLDKDAIVVERGKGTRKLVLFSDTECPYCRQLEATLATMADVKAYIFPVAMLGAPERGIAAWCAQDRAAAWTGWMLKGMSPGNVTCPNPLQRNASLAMSLGVRGTPMMFNERGEILAGAQSREAIEAWLAN